LDISRLVRLTGRIRNVSDESCRESQNTQLVCNFLFGKSCRFEILWKKYRIAGQVTDDNMAHAGY